MKPSEIPLFLRTVRHVPPAQIAHRIRLRTKRAAYARYPGDLETRWASKVPDNHVGWPADFQPIDWNVQHEPPAYSDAGRGVFNLVGETHDALRDGWRPADRSQLFRYHLHYMEWAWPMANSGTDQDRADFATLWRSWRADTVAGRWDEWSPYVVSLRAWVLCGVFEALVRGTEIEADVVRHLRACQTFLASNLELDVGGNHLIKNLKALVGLSHFLQDRSHLARSTACLGKQLQRQILDDGGHFELSPSYHVQVLADLIDVRDLSRNRDLRAAYTADHHLHSMARWLGAIRFPDDSLPALGDSVPLLGGLIREIDRRVPPSPPPQFAYLGETGFLVIRPSANTMAVFDLGPACPSELPAHSQADWGTFELWHVNQKLVTDPGISTYTGPRRRHERATSSHNSATAHGCNQVEVWAAFRAARRYSREGTSIHQYGDVLDVTSSISYSDRRHERNFIVSAHSLKITDTFFPSSPIRQSLLIPLEAVINGPLSVHWNTKATVSEDLALFGQGFGRLSPGYRLTAITSSPSYFHLDFSTRAAQTLGSARHAFREQGRASNPKGSSGRRSATDSS